MNETIRKMTGCKKVCTDSKILTGRNDGAYLQLNYDRKDNKVFTNFHCCSGHNDWTEYHDTDIVFVGFIDNPLSMAEVRGLVERCLMERGLNYEKE